MRLILLGPPGAGKGTQARMLSTSFGIPQVSSGDLLRAAARDGSKLGREARGFMERGELVPDELVVRMIEERLAQRDARKGFVLDGFPRNLQQAKTLDAMLKKNKIAIDRVLALMVPDEEIVKRISGRRTCRKCQAMYHVTFDAPKTAGVCDKCGGELFQRDDDAEETVRTRLKVYNESTRPLLEFYGNAGIMTEIDGLGHPEEIAQLTNRALDGLTHPRNGRRGRATARPRRASRGDSNRWPHA